MRRVWSQELVTEAVRAVGPRPVQPGGPEILVGTMGVRTVQYAAGWADGLAGVTLDLDVDAVGDLFSLAAGRGPRRVGPTPRLTTSFFFALGDEAAARDQMHRHLRHYMNWLPVELVDAMAPTTGFAGSMEDLAGLLRRFADVGTDEVHLIPTSSDISQVERAADVAASLRG